MNLIDNYLTESSTDIFIPNKKYNTNKTLMNKFDSDLTLELGSVEINKDILNAVLGIDKSRFPDAYAIQYIKVVQAKTHKKKRINKKWLKRYGYKQILCKTKRWELHNYTDGTFEFIKQI